MSKIDIESYKSFVGQQAILMDGDVEGVGIIVGISEEGEALIQKCIDMEGLEETDETVLIPVEEVKLRTFVVMEKVDEGMAEGGIVSWETSNGTYYGDIQSMSTDSTVRGEPQGLEIEGSEGRPAYVIRVWMWDEEEWIPTNVTVVAYVDALTSVEEMPQQMVEDDTEDETEDTPAMEEDGVKKMDIEKITEIVSREVAKALAGLEETEVKSDVVEEAVAEETFEISDEDIDAYVAAEQEHLASVEEKAMSGANGRVIATHNTAVERGAWDGPLNNRHVKSPGTAAYFNSIYAFQQPNTDGTMKTHYSFIHHFVSGSGDAGAASLRALATGIAVLNGGRAGTVLRGNARAGVYRHLAAHYRAIDMEAPELKSDDFVNDLMIKNGIITEAIIAQDEEITEEKAAEIVAEQAELTVEEAIAEVQEEVKADEVATEELKTEDVATEEVAEAVTETGTITFNDLKELHELLKVL